MSNDKDNQFHGELLTPEIKRKGVYELGKVARTPPTAGIFDEPTRCFRANLEWTPHILGMVHLLADVVSWSDAEDDDYFAIREILRFMQGEECMSLQLRQKPDDSCVLQQSLDNGETWADVFDFGLCVTIQDKSYQVQIQNQVTYVQPTFQEIYNNYTTNYAGTPESVYPDLAQPTGDDATYRAALCNALWALVTTACDTAISFYTENVNATQAEINFYLGVTAFVLTAIALAGAVPTAGASLAGLAAVSGLWAAGIGLGATVGNALLDFWQQHTIDQFQDSQAKEDVVCYLFNDLSGDSVSLDALRESVAGVLTGDPNGQAILDFLQILLEHDSTYAAFLEKWNNNKEFAEAGISLYCPCYEAAWKFKAYDFTQSKAGWADDPVQTASVMSWVAGVGWQAGGDNPAIGSLVLDAVEPGWRIRAVGWQARNLDNTALSLAQSNWWFRPTENSTVGQTNVALSSGTSYIRCRENLDNTGWEQFNIAHNTTAGKTIVIERAIIIFYPDEGESPYDAVVTEDQTVCNRA